MKFKMTITHNSRNSIKNNFLIEIYNIRLDFHVVRHHARLVFKSLITGKKEKFMNKNRDQPSLRMIKKPIRIKLQNNIR